MQLKLRPIPVKRHLEKSVHKTYQLISDMLTILDKKTQKIDSLPAIQIAQCSEHTYRFFFSLLTRLMSLEHACHPLMPMFLLKEMLR